MRSPVFVGAAGLAAALLFVPVSVSAAPLPLIPGAKATAEAPLATPVHRRYYRHAHKRRVARRYRRNFPYYAYARPRYYSYNSYYDPYTRPYYYRPYYYYNRPYYRRHRPGLSFYFSF